MSENIVQSASTMKVTHVPLADTGFFSDTFNAYLQQQASLQPFYGRFPSIQNFKEQIEEKQKTFPRENRALLTEVLKKQYAGLQISDKTKVNLAGLADENTFTITTGHQLNIFTGPLYFIYKIVTVINAAKALQAQYPEYRFVPVYWMASEDHDFDEIKYFSLFGKKYVWETDQQGAVGRFQTSGIEAILAELPEKVELFEKAYTQSSNLADAVRAYVNDLFGSYGLVVVDGDTPELKKLLVPIVQDDLLKNTSHQLVVQTNSKLSEAGHKPQIHAREINFFYLANSLRERIVFEDDKYKVLNTELAFNKEELNTLLQEHPERFSPNVVLRPVYQELILPNLAYCGGPAEIVYWLQLKEVFNQYQLPFPVLLPRNFAMVVNKTNHEKATKLELSLTDLLKSELVLKEELLSKLSGGKWMIEEEKQQVTDLFQQLKAKALELDKTLEGMIGAEEAKTLKGLENIEKRLKKAEEQKLETALNRIYALKEKLFPNGSLQERVDNFLNFYLNHPEFVKQLVDVLNPFEFSFNILALDE
jgi:bacillithiol biosynthesis cysteine-adding enzyme BshC